MTIIVLFIVVFVGGPLTFRALTRGSPTPATFRYLAAFTAICVAIGLTLRYGPFYFWESSLLTALSSVFFIWFGWIGVLAFGAQALRRMDRGIRMRRWTAVIGAAGTTVPWFGLAIATWLAA